MNRRPTLNGVITLARTPNVGTVAIGLKDVFVKYVTSRQHRKAQTIRAIVIVKPASLRLENFTRNKYPAGCRYQSIQFFHTWQMPTIRAYSLHFCR